MTNVPLQFFLLSARTCFSLHLIFLPRKKQVIKQNVRADISLVATYSLVSVEMVNFQQSLAQICCVEPAVDICLNFDEL